MVTLRSRAVKDANDNTDLPKDAAAVDDAKDKGKKDVKDNTTIVVFIGLLIDLLGKDAFILYEKLRKTKI